MASQGEKDHLVGEHVVSNRGVTSPYVLESWLAGGGFGQVFQGFNENTQEKVAVKLERNNAPQRQLYLEFGFYMRLGRDCAYVPRIHYFGAIDNWNALVMDMLGPSLKKLYETVGRYSSECTAAVGIGLMEIFQDFHDKGLIMRDVKPDNFLAGVSNTENAHSLYLIDLGLAKEWRTHEGEHIPFATGKPLTGTPQYISINMHKSVELSRRDDLESIIYMLIYLQTGTLPWFTADKECGRDLQLKIVRYGELKMTLSPEEICAKMPSHFKNIYKRVRKLQFEEDPDYAAIIKNFTKILVDRGLSVDDINRAFDWNPSHKKRPNRDRRTTRSNSRSKSPRRSKERRSKDSKKKNKKRDGRSN